MGTLMGNRTTWPVARKKSLLLEQDEILSEIDAKKEEFNQDVKNYRTYHNKRLLFPTRCLTAMTSTT